MLDLMCDGYEMSESASDTKARDSRWRHAYASFHPKPIGPIQRSHVIRPSSNIEQLNRWLILLRDMKTSTSTSPRPNHPSRRPKLQIHHIFPHQHSPRHKPTHPRHPPTHHLQLKKPTTSEPRTKNQEPQPNHPNHHHSSSKPMPHTQPNHPPPKTPPSTTHLQHTTPKTHTHHISPSNTCIVYLSTSPSTDIPHTSTT